jgi:hypothetical protein
LPTMVVTPTKVFFSGNQEQWGICHRLQGHGVGLNCRQRVPASCRDFAGDDSGVSSKLN